ncbi:glycoside hydrolase family 13 protein [Microbacterium sp. M3]|uniref:Glycoside hydrolase family 13 protein n=1 Tax=Microbacterium arthrosphaerae TaxID=792652 RepID=A0ABU4H1H4_9MICO|nr:MULTISPECIES: glycoside hydrolase family 13 protein [Microbacterium]MDW4571744.1 glycoside hydrolase family 13 protein [Microbacterium arthrosphaerae]MDW7605599.1 glycoside hydrolase family 13 protein [Microbacterium sp. M3]
MTSLAPHHDGSPLYVSDLAPSLGDVVTLRLRVPSGYGPLAAVRTRSNPDHEPEWTDAASLGTIDGWEWWEAPVTVRNPRHGYRWVLVHEDGRVEWLNQSGLHTLETLDAEDFALVAHPAPPAWLSEAVMYQVFPDRFARSALADERPTPDWAIPASWDTPVDPVMPARSQQFYGGDLDGVIEKLDHLVSLGVNLLYLTPIFPAASNHRYDAASFDRVDPLLGGDEAYRRLIDAAHARGIRVIGDLTSNHSGDRHEWFQAALGTPGAREEEFYYFTDAANTEYVSWLGHASLPKFDWSSDELRRRFVDGPDSVVAKWLQPPYSADGWRIDVANMTGRLGSVDLNAEVRQLLRRTMLEINPDAILLGESTNDAASDLQGDGWHGAMTYPSFTRPLWGWLSEPTNAPYLDAFGEEQTEPWFFTQPIGGIPRYTAAEFAAAVVRFTAGIPWRVRLGNMQPLDTHDTARFATNAGPGTIPLAVGLMVTLPGLPVVFAGDEYGLTGIDGEASRTPIPWGTEAEPAVAERLALYRELIALRHAHPTLSTGGLRWIHVDDDTVVFVRESADETLLVLASKGDADAAIPPGALPVAAAAEAVWGDAVLAIADDGSALLSADGPAFAVWRLAGVAVPAPLPVAVVHADEVSRGVASADQATPAEDVESA